MGKMILKSAIFALLIKAAIAVCGEVAVVPAPSSSLPPYDFPCKDGFYATIAGYNTIKEFKLPCLVETQISVEGFNCPVRARTITKGYAAPLVVLLLGAEGRAIDPLAKQWIAWYAEAGYHVLSFNSTLNAEFVCLSGRGVSGNVENEAQCVRDIVAAYLRSPQMSGQVTKVGIVGMSYGGIEALMLGKMLTEKNVPFEIAAIQAYSPPVDIMQAARLIDKWWREDRWNYTLSEIYFKVSKVKRCTDQEKKVPEGMLRAGVAASFRIPFADIVDRNDAVYDLKLLPVASTPDEIERRKDYATGCGFTRFLHDGSYPYWKEKLNLQSYSEFNANARLVTLLLKQPAHSETIIAADDPLNRPEDFEAVKAASKGLRVTILEHGGHLGFVNEAWTKAKLLTLFDGK